MGFYSIYKIFKDIFRTIFGNKALRFIFVILIVVFIYFLFNTNQSNAYVPDEFGLQEAIESKIRQVTGISASQFNANQYYQYVVCEQPITRSFLGFCFIC